MDFEENLINQYNQLKSRVNIKSGQHTKPTKEALGQNLIKGRFLGVGRRNCARLRA